jgi:anti-anti-sigma regulatory factor
LTPLRITLEGKYDLARKDEIAKVFASVDGRPEVIVVGKVTYLDSTILRELALLRLKQVDRHITLVAESSTRSHSFSSSFRG